MRRITPMVPSQDDVAASEIDAASEANANDSENDTTPDDLSESA